MKCCFCLKSGATENGFVKKLRPAFSHDSCAANYRKLAAEFGKWTPANAVTPAIDIEKLSASAKQNALFENDYSTIRVGDREWRVTAAGAGYRARLRLKDNLESCACTHKAKRHVEDSDGNLLHCRDCDCDHFWYAVPQVHNSKALVILSTDEISSEPTVLDKLQAVTRENGATPDEVITAQQKIIALMRKENRLAA
jgi:hypothetical protein